MCMYNLALNDELVRRTRQSFANEADMKAWLQRQVEALMIEYNTSQQTVRRSACAASFQAGPHLTIISSKFLQWNGNLKPGLSP